MNNKVTIYYEKEGIDLCGKFFVKDGEVHQVVFIESTEEDLFLLAGVSNGRNYFYKTSITCLEKLMDEEGFTQLPKGTKLEIEVG